MYQRTINIVNCAQEGASLITEQGVVREKMSICFNIKAIQTKWIQNGFKILENYVWIYIHTNDLNQDVALWGIWLVCSCSN